MNDSEKVEWWKGARSKSYQTIYCVIPGCRGSYWGGKVRLPQRPEVSPKQATPLPLPNRLRQPLNCQREPLDPESSLL